MIWCDPANNKSSTWNTSDTRFVVWVHKQVSSTCFGDEATRSEDLLQMVLAASRCASQTMKTFCSVPTVP